MAKRDKDRFICIYAQGSGMFSTESVQIFVDKETGVQYLWRDSYANGGFAGGFAVLMDQDGKPLLYQPPT